MLKKDGVTQRKLLMVVSFSYLAEDTKSRSRLGMNGGGALSRIHSSQQGCEAACCDQSNAFTALVVPEWMIPYQATPPIPAAYAMSLLPNNLRSQVRPETLVTACYMRLPIGFSHAVHILMQINFRLISMALASERFRQVCESKVFYDKAASEESSEQACLHQSASKDAQDVEPHSPCEDGGCHPKLVSDKQWWHMNQSRLAGLNRAAPFFGP